eukprot:440388_1
MRSYYKPKGWKIYGLNVNNNNNNNNNNNQLLNNNNYYCIGFHCTKIELLPSILRDGLVMPGVILSSNGYTLPIPPGHIKVDKIPGIDDDKFTQNIFLSPSINYCTFGAYCKPYKLSKYNKNKYNSIYAHLALKVHVKKDAIRVNRQTISSANWSNEKHKIDENYKNSEIEWRIRNPYDVIITGLCIYTDNITNRDVWKIKNEMRKKKMH